jgi:hypothetical protein
MFLFVYVLAAVLLVCLWLFGEVEFRTKLVLTLLYGATWLLLLASPYAVLAAQALMAMILGGTTFGVEFLGRRR